MKKLKSLFLCSIMGIMCLSSCTNEFESSNYQFEKNELKPKQQATKNLKALNLRPSIKVIYKGKEYVSEIDTAKGRALFTNNLIQELEQKISKLPNSGTLIYPDGSIELFDSEEDFKRNSLSVFNRGKNLINKFSLSSFNDNLMLAGGDHMLSGPANVTKNCAELYFYSNTSGLGSEIALSWNLDYEDKVITRNISGKMKSFIFFSMKKVRYLFCYDNNNNQGQWFSIFSNLSYEMNGVQYAMTGLNTMQNIHTGLPAMSIFDANFQDWSNRVKSIKISSFMGDY